MVPGDGTGRIDGIGVAARAWMARRRRPGRVRAARITSGRPRTAGGSETRGLPHSDPRTARSAQSGIRAPDRAANYRGCDALPRGPPARPRRGPARTPRRRPLPLARGRRRPAHAGVDRGPGRPRRRGARRACRCARSSPPGSEKLVHAGAVGVPVWRGERAFSTRRDPGQEHAVLRVREADGTERVLVDPMALDPAGTTTLDAWSPSWEGDRLAYQLSTGGDEESRLYVLDVATGEVVDGPIDRCRYSPVAWLPGGEELFYVRRLAPGARCPPARSSSTAASGATASARPADDRRARPRRGQRPDHLLRRAHQPRRPLAGRVRLGRHRAARRRLDRRPRRRRRAARLPGRRRRADRRVGRPRRPAVADVRPRHPALAARRRRSGRPGHLGAGGLAGRRPAAGRTPSCPTSPWSTAPDGGAAGARRARRRRHRPAVGVGRRTAPAGWPTSTGLGAGSISGVSAPPEGGTTAWVGYTDYATPPSVLRWDAGDADRAEQLGAGRRRRRGARR